MRILPFIIGLLLTITLVWALNKKWGPVPPMGSFLSPQQGFWQNAEPVNSNRSEEIKVSGLKGRLDIYLDERLVPHVFAEHDEDAFFAQGYLHAKYRLWQMEVQTDFAAGRLSERLGSDPRFLNVDRETRRLGMGYAAEQALKEMEADPETKMSCDAYTAGVNAYIATLTESSLPFEYKLLHYKPEPWSNLKIALFLKQMSRTLADYGPDLTFSAAKDAISYDALLQLNPQVPDSLVPIIPKGTAFDPPAIIPVPPATADSLYFERKDSTRVEEFQKQDPNNGSNNWVVSGEKTKSGAPILCNDPHLELSFPSIWFEIQLSTPNMNVYGASFPGSPNVIIGFNNDVAWGVTNSQRDVKDFYEIQFKDDSRREYLYNGEWRKTEFRQEAYHLMDGTTFRDTVAYTVFGPVLYDRSFSKQLSQGKAIAVRWAAHDPSNESRTFFKLNRAKNYEDYLDAIKTFTCPGQNFVFASKSGDIALWQQGRFPARWPGQGMYLMPGVDSSYAWQGFIPQEENPHAHQFTGFLQSANQRAVDSTYPYFIPGSYINARGVAISRKLDQMSSITTGDMMKLQNDNYSVFGVAATAMLLRYVDESKLDTYERRYLDEVKQWNGMADTGSVGTTIYQAWFDSLEVGVWKDEWLKSGLVAWSNAQNADSFLLKFPDEQTLLEWINRDSAFRYIDNITTPQRETITEIVTAALKKATPGLKAEEEANRLTWAKHKNPIMYHLLRDAALPFARKLNVGGWSNIINATTKSHGPSWRMIVQLSADTEAYGVYPGGQSGNPGSPYYDNSVDNWVKGSYYRLWMMKPGEKDDKRVQAALHFTNG